MSDTITVYEKPTCTKCREMDKFLHFLFLTKIRPLIPGVCLVYFSHIQFFLEENKVNMNTTKYRLGWV